MDHLIFSYNLIEEVRVSERKGFDADDWWNLLNSLILSTLKLDNCYLLTENAKLAASIAIVGAQHLVHYPTAFHLLCTWDFSGGCYWVVQEELMRHAALNLIRLHLLSKDSTPESADEIQADITRLVSVELISSAAHSILSNKLKQLHVDLTQLLQDILLQAHDDPWEPYFEYTARYPLESFVPWFMSWGLPLLRRHDEDCDERVPILLRLAQDMRLKFHLRSSGSNLQMDSGDDSSISLIKRVSSIQQDPQPSIPSICSDAVYEPCETPCSSRLPAASEQRIDKRKYTEVETYIVSRTKDLLRNARMPPPVTTQLAITPVSSICDSKGSDDDNQVEPTCNDKLLRGTTDNNMDSDSSSEEVEDTDMEEARLADGIDVLRGLGAAVWKIFSPEVLTQNSSSP